jgi:hypothetical protein
MQEEYLTFFNDPLVQANRDRLKAEIESSGAAGLLVTLGRAL